MYSIYTSKEILSQLKLFTFKLATWKSDYVSKYNDAVEKFKVNWKTSYSKWCSEQISENEHPFKTLIDKLCKMHWKYIWVKWKQFKLLKLCANVLTIMYFKIKKSIILNKIKICILASDTNTRSYMPISLEKSDSGQIAMHSISGTCEYLMCFINAFEISQSDVAEKPPLTQISNAHPKEYPCWLYM